MTRHVLRRAALAPLALGLAVALLPGCSSDPNVLARVGEVAITRDDFMAAAGGSAAQYGGSADSAKRLLLDDLVRRELLIQGARQSGLDDSLFRPGLERVEQQLTRDKLFKELVGGPIAVSEAEVKEFHRRRSTEARARIIFTTAEPMARAARSELDRGTDFGDAANRFNMPGMLPPGGDLGFIPPGSLVPPLDDYLMTARVDSIIGPLRVPTQGWFIMRVEERRPAQQPPFEMVRSDLANMLQQRKQRQLLMRAVDRMGQSYEVKVLPGAPNKVAERLGGSPLIAGMGGQSVPAPLSDAENATQLGTYRGGEYTLGDAANDLNGAANPPPLTMLPMVERWLHNQLLERAAKIEANRRRLAQDPEIRRELRDRLKSAQLEAYYNSAVAARVQSREEDVRALYATRADAFVRLDEVKVLLAVLPDSSAAAQLIMHGGHTGTLREAAAMAAPNLRVRLETIRYPNSDPFWRPLQPSFIGMGPRAYGGPYRRQDGWMVLQVVSKVQGTQAFESLPEGVVDFLRNEALEQRREQRLAELSDSLQRSISIRTFPERLARIPWPPPPSPNAAPLTSQRPN